ncbi:MAG: peptidase [Gemmatimonadota bacterium]|nr:peptidase [Gemmatimonadota bacterium]
MARPARILFVFLDGVGIGTSDPERNPFLRARAPALTHLFGGEPPDLEEPVRHGPDGAAFPLDAGLGVNGTPQSGTGQSALLTGLEAGTLFGGHFGPWVPVRLRPLVEERSVLRAVTTAGGAAAFANAYPRGWPGPNGSRRIAGPPLAARGAGLLDRHEEALEQGRAVSSEIVNDGWRQRLGRAGIPDVTPEHAGRNLAAIANHHDLTLYAHYGTDTAGHTREMSAAVTAIERVDRFVQGVLESLAGGTLLFIASDHGNLEDVWAGHTRNPALGLATGPGWEEATALRDLRDVAPYLRRCLGA